MLKGKRCSHGCFLACASIGSSFFVHDYLYIGTEQLERRKGKVRPFRKRMKAACLAYAFTLLFSGLANIQDSVLVLVSSLLSGL